jgi:RecJ-like exonuclease
MDFGILQISLIISIAGLLILTFANESLEPPLSVIDQINANHLGKNVHLRGNVSGIHEFKGGSVLLTLEDYSGKIDVYLSYGVVREKPDLLKARELDIIGSVEVYGGRLEILIESIDGIRVIK